MTPSQTSRLKTLQDDLDHLLEASEVLTHALNGSTWGRAELADGVTILARIKPRREVLKAAAFDVMQGKEPKS